MAPVHIPEPLGNGTNEWNVAITRMQNLDIERGYPEGPRGVGIAPIND